MKQVVIRKGGVVVEEMPAPMCGEGEVLVRTAWSLLSPGTETASLAGSAAASGSGRPWMRRLSRLGEAAHLATTRPPREALRAIAARLEGPSAPTGYSLAGWLLEVGGRVPDLVPGQRVACAGAGHANHAEIVAVPRNLVVAVPDGLALEQAAFVTVGAIALQGLRQADLRLGESAVVVGLGLIGQLTVMLLRASGCRAFGVDIDPRRVERALGLGLEAGWVSGRVAVEEALDRATGGHGADAVVVCAASGSSEPARLAVRLVRRRGRVVLSGAVGLDLDRNELYLKEADLRIASAYGPGRYDPSYEEEGIDYPYAFVRWTENRNLEEFLRLAAEGQLPIAGLIEATFPLAHAAEAYARLAGADEAERPLGVLLHYPAAELAVGEPAAASARAIDVVPQTPGAAGLGVALVGPGNHARAVHLPALAALAPLARLRLVVGRDPVAAREAARISGAVAAATDLEAALSDPAVAVVLIATRHDQHAEPAARALEAGKAVYLEKPLALDEAGIRRVERALETSRRPFTLGLNRRFARDILALRCELSGRRGPLLLDYRVRAERLPRAHWALGPEGGGRLVGEAVHMIDLLGHLVGRPRTAHALSLVVPPAGSSDLARGENFVLSLGFADGSLATLSYTTLGDGRGGKERIEAHWDGRSAAIEDFSGLRIDGADAAPAPPDKGHTELLRRFLEHVAGRGPEPIACTGILELSRFMLTLDREARGAPAGPPASPEQSTPADRA